MERGGGEAGVGLQQHEAGVRAGVDVQLIVLVPPREAPPRLLDTVVLLSVSLSQTVDWRTNDPHSFPECGFEDLK